MNDKNIRELIDKNILKIKDTIKVIRGLINKNSKVVVVICVLVLIANFFIVLFYFLINTQNLKFLLPTKKSASTSVFVPTYTPTLTSTPTPYPLVQGPQTYSISMKSNPQMYEVWFNTIDPKKGTQQVKLKVRDKLGGISSVTAIVKTDKLSKKYSLSLLSGPSSDGVWTGSWKLNDTYSKNFVITFSATDDKGNKSSVDLTIR